VYQGSCNNSFNNRFEHIELQPNPTNGNTTLIIIAPGYGEIEVKILNLQGSLIENLNYNLNEGSNRINLLTENFQRGTYIIRIKLTGNNLNMQRNFKLFKV
jgi:hypothetical protein